jgi:type I restriction enzyme S subunit
MKTYDKYKDTDIDWLPSIPENWKKQRIKTLFSLHDERNFKHLNEVNLISLYTSVGVIQHTDIDHTTGNKARNADGYKIVNGDDIIVNIMLCWMGAIGRSAYNGVTSPAYDVYTPHIGVNSSYYHYLFRTPAFSQQCFRNGHGIMLMRWRTYSPQFTNISVPVPPLEEQTQIVRFLDWKVSEINQLIAIKKEELELIKEYIVTLTYKSFTDTKTNLKRVVSLENDFIAIDDDAYYSKAGMFNRGRGIFLRPPMNGRDLGTSSFQRIHKDCLMISGQFAWEDAVYITQEKDESGIASHRYYLLKSTSKKFPIEYLWAYYITQEGFSTLVSCSHGAAGRNRPLNINELLKTTIPIPNEKNIYQFKKIVRIYMQMQETVGKYESSLHELKNRLISDVVTGKMDVRGIEIPDYEFVAESVDEEMDEADCEEQEDET